LVVKLSMTTLTLKASAILLTLSVFATHAQPPDRSQLRALPIVELKAAYLECEQLASTTLLDSSTAADCSLVAEELLERGFGGNFQRMLTWWRSARNDRKQ
jgi:hypothetical protein